jgi:tetratricopeptide (TPR) repeat protein
VKKDTQDEAEEMTKSSQLLARALEYEGKGESQEALNCALEGLKHNPTPLESAELNHIVGSVLLERGQLSEAFDHITTARRHALTSGDSRVLCKTALDLGRVYVRMSRYALADKAWSEALTLANINGDVRLQGRILVNEAIIRQRYGDHTQALELLEDAKRRLEKVGDLKALATCYECIAGSYMKMDEPELALKNLEMVEDLARQLDDKILNALTQYRRGALHYDQDNFRDALRLFEDTYELLKEVGHRNKNMAVVLCSIIKVHLRLNRIDEALTYIKEASTLAKELDLGTVTSMIEEVRGEIAVYEGAGDRAIHHFTEAVSYAEEAEDVERFRVLHESLGIMAKELGFEVTGLNGLFKRVRVNYLRFGLKKESAELEEWLKKTPG